ncbi:tRNA delta(2)-isopentenylpyrophosphate transferase [Sulfobacillus acidophilus TPY]|uniref:tRNA dimethylallyltransferase n=1 Tax=Sulfobacillus acidophilus (strain ATCC 700253 / DSM 10332 / NAL) TaxID=679936 RepID=G8U085_SULAD|nr:tRNA delta(2)-isopentenylpyrophosphate transferase [Sulfobacillus acidophilus TPY]AEW05334.1 tRNA dimethylallyltransferase [Sulfobacillus acidophilus DSM 10332]
MDAAAKIPLLVIAGPTAVGKTALSLAVAEQLAGEIVSADSAQVYRGLDIGSAKVSPAIRQKIPHHLIDIVEPDQPFSVADYQRAAQKAIAEIAARGRLPILVGGTGLWIRAVVQNFDLPEDAGATPWRARLMRQGETQGWDGLRRQLRVVDPASYVAIQPNDHRRLVRALEVFFHTGRRLKRSPGESPYAVRYWVLSRPPSQLHRLIEQRVRDMLAAGLVDEVRRLLANGVPPHAQSLSAIGYREVVQWLYGQLTAEERDRLIIRHTQQYAKRQLTWFRSEKMARWLDLSAWTPEQAVDAITASLGR